MRLALFIFFTRRDKKALRVKAIIIPAGNSSKNNGKTRAINVKWWCDFFLKVWLFKFIIDSSPPLKNKWGSGEQSAVSSRSNFVALTCLQIKRGKLPAGGEVAERSEELRKRERALLHERVKCSSFCSLFFLKRHRSDRCVCIAKHQPSNQSLSLIDLDRPVSLTSEVSDCLWCCLLFYLIAELGSD